MNIIYETSLGLCNFLHPPVASLLLGPNTKISPLFSDYINNYPALPNPSHLGMLQLYTV